jgi:pimeloyl-ACP methyl ester carboxylesterase
MTGRRQHHPRLALPGGGELSGYLSHGDAAGRSVLLYVHGFASVRTGQKAEALEAMCARRGWPFAAFEFRGHGASSGTLLDLRGDALLDDLDAVCDHLAGAGLRRVFPVGSSMGGWATAWFALRRPESVPAAAFIAPAFGFVRNSWNRLSEPERLAWERSGRLAVHNIGRGRDEQLHIDLVRQADRFPSDELARRWATPALIFHSLRDDSVSYLDSLDVVVGSAFPEIELRLLTGGDHRQPAPVVQMADEIGRFFASRW